ncbi:MAG: hypothetical protein J3Q66DRAFT_369861 [Benniella sp.]|nr:MAG: hypothetical protein J3Q66DRAFT_369861 [Benniella sp.]
MVSKFFALTLVAAVVSQVNAYYYHAETFYQPFGEETSLFYNVHPVDIQIPENTEAVGAAGGIVLNETRATVTILFQKHGYEDVLLNMDHSKEELVTLNAMDGEKEKAVFPCVKMDEIEEFGFYNQVVTRKVYSCGNRAYFGRKGIPVPAPTTRAVPTTTTTVAVPTTTTPPPAVVTTTTTNVVTTTNVPTTTTIVTSVATEPITTTTTTTTTLAPQPTPTCLAGYRGKRNGKGPNGACCSHSDDCKDTCVKGVCGVHP